MTARQYDGRSRARDEAHTALGSMELGEEKQFRLTQAKDTQRVMYYLNRKKVKEFNSKLGEDCLRIWRIK